MESRVAIIAIKPYPFNTFLRQQAEIVVRTGKRVDILCSRAEDQPKFENSENIYLYRIINENLAKLNFIKYILISIKFILAAFIQLEKNAREKPYDIIICHALPEFLIFSGILQKIRGTRLILYLWDLSHELFKSRWEGVNKRSWPVMAFFLKLSEKLSCAIADHLITANEGFKEKLIQRGISSEKLTIIYNTAHPEIFKFDDKRKFVPIIESAKLIYHGTVSERFGLLRAINAIGKLQSKIPNIVLYIYGQYDPIYRKKIEERVTELRLTNNIILNGRLDLEDIYKIIKEVDIGIVPYINNDFMNLALSTKTFEYIAAGLPVVASRLKSTYRLFDDSCITYFDPDSEDDLETKILSLYSNPKLREQKVYAAAKGYIPYSGKEMSKRFIDLINKMSKNHQI
jgi:glycosyltransferase involved in cell wall biosynthesis